MNNMLPSVKEANQEAEAKKIELESLRKRQKTEGLKALYDK